MLYSRLRAARPAIVLFFDASPRRVYTEAELSGLLLEYGDAWGLPRKTTHQLFVDYLLSDTRLRRHSLKSSKGQKQTRYSWGRCSRFEMAQSLAPSGYLSHGTAAFLLDLSDAVPETLYVNREQSQKPAGGHLAQEALDVAFSRPQRTSGTIFHFQDTHIVMLSGKQSGSLGVEPVAGPGGEGLKATTIERTLIDIVVRPVYAGGVNTVLQAYRNAKGRADAGLLLKTLGKLGHVYPYHQSIGFLMQRAGWPEVEIAPFRELGLSFDFYLAHGEGDTTYDPSWRIRYPSQMA